MTKAALLNELRQDITDIINARKEGAEQLVDENTGDDISQAYFTGLEAGYRRALYIARMIIAELEIKEGVI